MGFIYSFPRITAQEIPSQDDFRAVRAAVEEAMAASYFLTAVPYGSVWSEVGPSPRSDVDFIAVCRQSDLVTAAQSMETLRGLSQRHHIYLSAHLLTVAQGRAGDHGFNSTHRVTFRRLHEAGLVKGCPQQWILCPGREISPDIGEKLASVLASTIRAAQVFRSVRGANPLDTWIETCWQEGHRPLRLHVGFARWMMWTLIQEDIPITKEELLEVFLSERGHRPYHDGVRKMVENNRSYDHLLQEVMAGRVEEEVYRQRVLAMVRLAYAEGISLLSMAVGRLGSSLREIVAA